MEALQEPLRGAAKWDEIKDRCMEESGMIQIAGCVSSQKTHFAYAVGKKCKHKVIVCADELNARGVYEEYLALGESVCYFPPKDLLFYQVDLRGKEMIKNRMEVFKHLIEDEKLTIVTGFDAFMDSLPKLAFIKKEVLKIRADGQYALIKLRKKLIKMGYEMVEQVEAAGQCSIRGGIVDIYALTEEVPFRIEFWDDEIDSIRSFDVESQRSIENLQEISIYPASEYPEEKNRVTFLEYFDKHDTLFFLDEPKHLLEKGKAVASEFVEAQAKRMENGYEILETEAVLRSPKEVAKKMNAYCSIGLTALDVKVKEFKVKETIDIGAHGAGSYNGSFDLLTKDLKALKRNGYKVLLLCASRSRAKRLAEDLRDYNLSSFYSEDGSKAVNKSEIMLTYGYIREGYEYPLLSFRVISESDIFGHKRKRKKRKKYEGRKIQDFSELKVGNYVVHENHGLGIYLGIEKKVIEGITKDYIKIEYAGGSTLYILITQLDMIQKYAGSEGRKPKLNKLGTKEWSKTKGRIKNEVEVIAKELVELYAKRQETEGYMYGEDTVWQQEFEEMFPYEETQDQLIAIEDVKRDMESRKIMDRLICGDVGYGKTEIAIRAAFKSVQENKQVVYLVPTTILAQQHYNTFIQRMKDFPIRVDLLCRFRTAAQQKKTIADTNKGMVDILIGTHRVLSKDVSFKDLGLLVIDEEQRFGVKHKETIKAMKESVDVLSLSATPIPRTLHMSLIGIRGMSVLEEPPIDRMPIQTYVLEYNDEMVREAIQRELARNGQVYYVFNRVEDIVEMTGKLQKLVPQAVIEYAHGQMKENRLEDIMYSFIEGEIDVLVSTTIIETGMDISNANTLIIHDADKFGLSQLYQLRGRVGRSSRQGYAFLLYQKNKILKEIAEKRLSAIRSFTELGSGVKIAMRDLEIRGAGNLLGEKQHGHIEAVGYDLYCKMLNEAVKYLKGEIKQDSYITSIDIDMDAYIPDRYIQNEYQRLEIYKRIASIENETEIEDVIDELNDRFGDMPIRMMNLFEITRLKIMAHEVYIELLEQRKESYYFYMYKNADIRVENIPLVVEEYRSELEFKAEEKVYFVYKKRNMLMKKEEELARIKQILAKMKDILLK